MVQSGKQRKIITPTNRATLRKWFEDNHTSSESVWLIIKKKNSKIRGISLNDAVEEALCFGWIDSRLNILDDKRYKLLFSPRKSKSIWSKTNKLKVERLIHQGLMTEAGFEKIDAAKKDGSWDTLDSIEDLMIPVDLQKALDDNPIARKNFVRFSDSLKKRILYWIQSAKQAQTRLKRIRQTVAIAEKNDKKSL